MNDAHLVAPTKNLTARNRLDVSFVPAPKPQMASNGTTAGPVPGTTAAAPAAASETQANNQAQSKKQPDEPNMIALADLVEATIVVDANPDAQNAKGKPTGNAATRKASSSTTAGDPNSTYEVRDARLFGKVRLHQDPSPGKTKGQDATGEALILHNEGPGKAIFNLYHDPRAKKAERRAFPRRPLAEVITEDQTIKGEVIGVNQNTDEAWVDGPGQLVQMTDRNLMTDKTDEPGKTGGESAAAKDAQAIKPKPITRAGKVQPDRVPLVITWQEKMRFHGRSLDPENHPSAKAEFFKEVWAFMEDGKLYSRDIMTTYTDKPIPLADLGKMNQKKTAVAGSGVNGQVEVEGAEKAEEPKPDLTLIQLVGQAQAITRKVDPDRPVVLSQQVIRGDTIIYDRRTGDFQVPSSGMVYLYDRGDNTSVQPGPKPVDNVATRRTIRPTSGRPDDRPGRKAPEPGKKQTIQPLVLTQIKFTREMKGRFGTGRETDKTAVRWADFFGNIETARAVVPNERKSFDYDRLPPDAYFLTSQTMRVVTEPPPPGSPENAPARNFLKAWENAFARTNDTTISADVITYDSRNDLMYANGEEGRLVQVVKQNSVGQPMSPTVAEAVRVNPQTGAADVIGSRDLMWVDTRTGTRPKPLPPPDPNAKKPKKPKKPYKMPRTASSAGATRDSDVSRPGSVNVALGGCGRGRCRGRPTGGVPRVPAFGRANRDQFFPAQAMACEPRGPPARTKASASASRAGQWSRRIEMRHQARGLLEILFPESPAAQDAQCARGHRQLDLLHVVLEINPRREEYPRPLTDRVERPEIVQMLALRLDTHRAGKLRLVDVAERAQEPGRLDGRGAFPRQVTGALLLLAAKRKRVSFQKQQDIVFLAFAMDLLDKLKLMFGRVGFGRFELNQELDGVGPHELDLLHAPAGLDGRQRCADLVLWAARHLVADQQARAGRNGLRGDRRPGAVVGVDEHSGSRRRQVAHQVELGVDDLVVRRLAHFAAFPQGLRRHLDHRAVLVQGQHGEGAVGIADPLQAPELAGRQPSGQQGHGTSPHRAFFAPHRGPSDPLECMPG